MVDAGRTGVFISHAHADAELAGLLSQLIRSSLGLSTDRITCTSHPETGLLSGEPLRTQIRERLNSAAVLVLLWTRHSEDKDWIGYEAAHADAQSVPLHVLVPGDADQARVPDPYRHLTWVSLTNGGQIVALVDRLAHQLSVAAPTIRPLDLAAILSHLHAADREAREREQADRLAHLTRTAGNERRRWVRMLTAVAGIAVAAVLYLLFDNNRLSVAYQATRTALEKQEKEHSTAIVEMNEIHTRELRRFSLRGRVSMKSRLPQDARLEVFRIGDPTPLASQHLGDKGEYSFNEGQLEIDPHEAVDFVVPMQTGSAKRTKASPADARLDIVFE